MYFKIEDFILLNLDHSSSYEAGVSPGKLNPSALNLIIIFLIVPL